MFNANQPYKFISRFELEDADPGDLIHLVSYPAGSCLYVTDNGNRCIWRIVVTRMSHTINRFVDVEGSLGALSVTSDGRLLVMNTKYNRLAIYNCDGALERNVLPENIGLMYPQNAVETAKGTILVCNGLVTHRSHMVSELSSDGEDILCSYGNDYNGIGPKDLSKPVYLFVRSQDQNVFVVDSVNKRINLLNNQLNFISTMSTDDYRPTCMFFDCESDNLIIGASDRGIRILKWAYYASPKPVGNIELPL